MTENITAENVIAFLENTPDFFMNHPETLATLQVRTATSEKTISFADHQIAYLRIKIADIEKKMMELLDFGLENDQLLMKYHRLSISLLNAQSLNELFDGVYTTVRNDFNLPYVAIRIWSDKPTLLVGVEFDPVSEVTQKYIEQQDTPYMGDITALPCHNEISDWLQGSTEMAIGSITLLPLRVDNNIIGALLLGSDDKAKFTQKMGTFFLENMAEQVATAISRKL